MLHWPYTDTRNELQDHFKSHYFNVHFTDTESSWGTVFLATSASHIKVFQLQPLSAFDPAPDCCAWEGSTWRPKSLGDPDKSCGLLTSTWHRSSYHGHLWKWTHRWKIAAIAKSVSTNLTAVGEFGNKTILRIFTKCLLMALCRISKLWLRTGITNKLWQTACQKRKLVTKLGHLYQKQVQWI